MSRFESIFTNKGLAEVAALVRKRGDNPFGIEPAKPPECRCAIESCRALTDADGRCEGACPGARGCA